MKSAKDEFLAASTCWMIDWMRHPDQQACLAGIKAVMAITPDGPWGAIVAAFVIRHMSVTRRVGDTFFEPGMLNFVSRAIETLFAVVDWEEVAAAIRAE